MSLDALFPFGGDHSIQSAVFVVDWKEPLTDREHKDIRGRMAQRLSAFNDIKPAQQVTINLGTLQSGQAPGAQIVGAVYELPNGFGKPAKRAISVVGQQIQITINDYRRWANAIADVDKYLSVICEPIVNKSVASLGLQYSDVFTWRDEPSTVVLKEIFREDSEFLPSNVFSSKSFWHSHNGFFVPFDDLQNMPDRLDNVNISCANNSSDVLTYSIVTSHKVDWPKGGWPNNGMSSFVKPIYESFHKTNKKILGRLLTSEVCSQIKLS